MKTKISVTIDEHVLKDIDSIIDNITIRNRSQAIEFLAQNALGEKKSAVILSGGEESKLHIGRDYRLTARVGNSTVIERMLRTLRENGFTTVYIVARQKVLTKAFEIVKDGSNFGTTVHYVEEKQSSGSADSLQLVSGKINKDFLVVYGHVLFDKINLEELWNQHLRQHSIATLLLTTAANPREKGTVIMEGSKILDFVQKPRKTDVHLVFSAMFIASPDIFPFCHKSLEYDAFPKLAKQGLLRGHLSAAKETHVHTAQDLKSAQ